MNTTTTEAEAYAAGIRYRAALADYVHAVAAEDAAARRVRAALANVEFIAQCARLSGVWQGYDDAAQEWRDASSGFAAACNVVERLIPALTAARTAARAAGFPVD